MSTTTQNMGLVKPDINDKIEDTISALASNFDRIDKASWVGMVIYSSRIIDPKDIYGANTEWTPRPGRMLVGAGTDFPAGTTGGEKEHTLTVGEMPTHRHDQRPWWSDSSGPGGATPYNDNANLMTSMSSTGESGGNEPHNNMPPFWAVYIWERTA